MNNSQGKRNPAVSAHASTFKLNPVATACAMFLCGVAATAHAQEATAVTPAAPVKLIAQATPDKATKDQDAAPPAVQSITVVGIRRGIEDAISAKKNSDMIVETISAEDIGKLPDDSIADALSSLPGVSAQVIGGRSATLNVRGLSGDFVNTLFNGREQASTSDNRVVRYDQYPAELINAATVYKTPDAALIGQGLAATIDLKTLLPLDFTKEVAQVKVMGVRDSLGKLNPEVNANGDKITASYIDQFANRTIGVALGYAHLDQPVQDQQVHSWGYGNGPTQAPGFPNATSIQGAEWWSDSYASVRDGLMGVLQYKPTKEFSSVLDTYYSRSSENDFDRGLQTATYYGGVTNATANSAGFLTSGNGLGLGGPGAYGSNPVVRNDFNTENDHIFSIGWKNTLKVGDWTLLGDLSGSTASAAQSILETYSGAFTPVTANFTANPYSGMALSNTSFNFADPSAVKLGDPGGWGQDGYDKFPVATDKVRQLRLSAKRDLDSSIFSSVEFGANETNRDKTRSAPEYFVNFANTAKTSQVAIPSNYLVGPVSLPGGPTITGYNALGLLASGMYSLVDNAGDADVYAKNWSVDEKISTAYTQFNIDTNVANMPLRGNMGLQFVHSKQSSEAIESNGGGTGQPDSGGASYSNWLPSLNLVATLPQDQLLRFGAAQELQRPRFDQMNASAEAGLNTTTLLWSSTNGNPQLRPTLADAVDLSYEKYFGKKAYFSVTPFYKYLKTYIYQEAESFDYTGFPTNGLTPISNIGTATEYVNGSGGSEKGIELTVSMPFELIHPVLTGFGVQANATRGSSSIQTNFNGTTSESSLPGFSSTTTYMEWYYENENGFSLRWKENYRSSFLGEVQGFGADLAYSEFLGVHTAAMQASFEFKNGPMKGLTALFEVFNLNNPSYTQTYGVGQGMSQSDRYGRTYLLGVNYKM